MSRTQYNKLVRDRIPEIIEADGKEFQTEIMGIDEHTKALLSKLVEEAQEVAGSSHNDIAMELADLSEVIDAIMETLDIDPQLVKRLQKERHEERGGFQKRIKLLWTE